MSRHLSLAARWRLLRHSAVALLASVVVGSGAAGFAAGQVAVHLTGGLALAPTVTHQQQQSGQVQGALGQRVGAQVAHQTVARTVYAPPAAAQTNAHPPESGSPGGKHADKGHGKHDKGDHGKGDHGKGDHGKHDKGGQGGGQVGGPGQGHGDGGHGDGGHGSSGPHPGPANPSHGQGHG